MNQNIAALVALLLRKNPSASIDVGMVMEVGASHASVSVGDKVKSVVKVPGSLLGSVKAGQMVRLIEQDNTCEIIAVLTAPSARPKAMLTVATGSISDNSTVNLDFNGATINYETVAGMVDTAVDRIKVPTAGYYVGTTTVRIGGNSSGNRLVEIKKNGVVYASSRPGAPTTAVMHMSCTTPPLLCAVNDYWEVDVTIGSAGASLSLNGLFGVSWNDYAG